MKGLSIGILLFFILIIGGGITLASLETEVATTEVTKTITPPNIGQ